MGGLPWHISHGDLLSGLARYAFQRVERPMGRFSLQRRRGR